MAIVYLSWIHYSHLNILFIYLFGSHLAAITKAFNCNQRRVLAALRSAGCIPGVKRVNYLKFLCLLALDSRGGRSRMPAAATSQIKHITNATPSIWALLLRLKRLEMCQQSDKFRTNYAASTTKRWRPWWQLCGMRFVSRSRTMSSVCGRAWAVPGHNKRRRNYYCIKWNY